MFKKNNELHQSIIEEVTKILSINESVASRNKIKSSGNAIKNIGDVFVAIGKELYKNPNTENIKDALNELYNQKKYIEKEIKEIENLLKK